MTINKYAVEDKNINAILTGRCKFSIANDEKFETSIKVFDKKTGEESLSLVDGKILIHHYDEEGRPIEMNSIDGRHTVKFFYKSNGIRKNSLDGLQTIRYFHHPNGHIKRFVDIKIDENDFPMIRIVEVRKHERILTPDTEGIIEQIVED